MKGVRSGKTAKGAREWVRKGHSGTRRLALSIGNSERNRGPKGGRPCEEQIVASGEARIAHWRGLSLALQQRWTAVAWRGRGCDSTLDDFGV